MADSPLSDRDYQELIERRVREAIRLERQSIRRWRLGIAVTALAALTGFVATTYRDLNGRFTPVEAVVEGYAERPYVDRLETPFVNADSLVIRGSAFGDSPGWVELFYKRTILEEADSDPRPTRSATVTLTGSSIEDWTDERIIVNTTEEQRAIILESMDATDFQDLVPYIRVRTADNRRSPLW